ncbi:carbohydrate porin [Methylobacterium durans]|uniref:carbohydrate porin n=1 Tax=Methylobacterium durans TaxID=2202825 RepID=UPI002AFF1067|nr:carbohydrate porin [Methylobacterium durans]MEA1834377.1 carbohydrate porin [Methylobacterium durans]
MSEHITSARAASRGASGGRAAALTAALCTAFLAGTPVLAQTAPAAAPPPCLKYDALMIRGVDTPFGSFCETIEPELGGVRGALAEHGIGFLGFSNGALTYDVLGHDARKQRYIGQIPTFTTATLGIFTYETERVGLGKGSQLTVIPTYYSSSYKFANDRGVYLAQFSLFHPFLDNHIEVQAGYARTVTKFAFSIAGTTLGSSALGPISNIPLGLGLSAFRPTPNADIRIYAPGKEFYTHFGVARSISPEGIFEDARLNETGLRFGVPGAGPLFVNETGYKVEPAPDKKKVWVRGGVIYNQSDFAIFNRPGQTGDNFGYFFFADFQLTQPSKVLPFQGLYIGAKYDKARADRNPFGSDYSVTLYQIGTFETRPFDVVAIGVSKSFVGSGLKQSLRRVGLDPAASILSVTGSYNYRVQGGLYVNLGLTYTDNPTIATKSPGALNASLGVSMIY